MAIEKFSKNIIDEFFETPARVYNTYSNHPTPTFDHVLVDLNCFFYYFKNANSEEVLLNKLRSFLFTFLTKHIKAEKTIFLASGLHTFFSTLPCLNYSYLDGPCSRAKLLTQRERRLVKVWDLIEQGAQLDTNSFSSLNFTAGTALSVKLNAVLHEVAAEISNFYKGKVSVMVSDTNQPHEGEFKLFDFYLNHFLPEQSNTSPEKQTSFGVIGGDSDLFLYALQLMSYLSTMRIKNSVSIIRTSNPTTFKIFPIYSFYKSAIGEFCNANRLGSIRVVDDFCFFVILNGNDYTPKLRSFDFIKTWQKYKELMLQRKFKYLIQFKDHQMLIDKNFLAEVIQFSDTEIQTRDSLMGSSPKGILAQFKQKSHIFATETEAIGSGLFKITAQVNFHKFVGFSNSPKRGVVVLCDALLRDASFCQTAFTLSDFALQKGISRYALYVEEHPTSLPTKFNYTLEEFVKQFKMDTPVMSTNTTNQPLFPLQALLNLFSNYGKMIHVDATQQEITISMNHITILLQIEYAPQQLLQQLHSVAHKILQSVSFLAQLFEVNEFELIETLNPFLVAEENYFRRHDLLVMDEEMEELEPELHMIPRSELLRNERAVNLKRAHQQLKEMEIPADPKKQLESLLEGIGWCIQGLKGNIPNHTYYYKYQSIGRDEFTAALPHISNTIPLVDSNMEPEAELHKEPLLPVEFALSVLPSVGSALIDCKIASSLMQPASDIGDLYFNQTPSLELHKWSEESALPRVRKAVAELVKKHPSLPLQNPIYSHSKTKVFSNKDVPVTLQNAKLEKESNFAHSILTKQILHKNPSRRFRVKIWRVSV